MSIWIWGQLFQKKEVDWKGKSLKEVVEECDKTAGILLVSSP